MDNPSLRWTPSLGPGTVEIKVLRRLPFLFSSSLKVSSSRFLLFFLSLLWVCGQRVCVVQAKAAYPQLQPVAPPLPFRCATRSLVVGCSLPDEADGGCRSLSIGRCRSAPRGRRRRLSDGPPHI